MTALNYRVTLLLFLNSYFSFIFSRYSGWEEIRPYCEIAPKKCMPYRDDDAFMPYYDSRCYCDHFCFRGPDDHDCCPDFEYICSNVSQPQLPPPSIIEDLTSPFDCVYDDRLYKEGDQILQNCNLCICRRDSYGKINWECETNMCANDPALIKRINEYQQSGWKAVEYERWKGKSIKELLNYTLGTILDADDKHRLLQYTFRNPEVEVYAFKAPLSWNVWEKGWNVAGVKDQQKCGISWVLSALDVASDRLSEVESIASVWDPEKYPLSTQYVLSCTEKHAKDGCRAGRLDYVWGFLMKQGSTPEVCYPYESGTTGSIEECKILLTDGQKLKLENNEMITNLKCPNESVTTGDSLNFLFQFGPAYRVRNEDRLIQYELYTRGPVQATMLVCPDFFQYKSGVYKRIYNSDMSLCDYHSVRIIGWGTEQDVYGKNWPYWLCVNSWGTEWGENGYFKILREDSEINEYIVTTWGRSEKFR